jgi:stearoyl-CoA desaturase (delta-9 desaturase)
LWSKRDAGRESAVSTTKVVIIIITFFLSHWLVSVFFQSFFLHRYGAHRMFTMSKGWERFFYLCTFMTQGSSFLSTRGYAILHREHHAFSDTPRDPHSPHVYQNFIAMMEHTKNYYRDINRGKVQPEARFEGGYPTWPALDRLSERWSVRIAFGAAYSLFYLVFAPHWAWFALLPIHFIMGPVHGAIVNWAGHKYGYRNFETKDRSKNTLIFDVLTMGELFQNNHHKRASDPNFAARWFEIDPTYQVMRLFHLLGMIKMPSRSKDAADEPLDEPIEQPLPPVTPAGCASDPS